MDSVAVVFVESSGGGCFSYIGYALREGFKGLYRCVEKPNILFIVWSLRVGLTMRWLLIGSPLPLSQTLLVVLYDT